MSILDDFNIEPGKPMGFKIELMHPSIQCLVGFQYFPATSLAKLALSASSTYALMSSITISSSLYISFNVAISFYLS